MSSLASYTALHSVIQDSIGGVRTADQLNAGTGSKGSSLHNTFTQFVLSNCLIGDLVANFPLT